MDNCLVSVIVPVYNIENYIERCIESIQQQTYQNIEIILVNDGSQDSSLEKCRKYAETDQRIKLINKKNGGLSDARNAAINISTGEYLCFIDGDDYIHPQFVELLLKCNISKEADISVCRFTRVKEDKKCIFSRVQSMEKIYNAELVSQESAIEQLLLGDKYVEYTIVWNKMYKRELFNSLRFELGKIHEDDFIMYKLFYNAKTIAYLPATLYYYVYRDDSIMANESFKSELCKVEAFQNRADFLIKKEICIEKGILSYLWCVEDFLLNYRKSTENIKLCREEANCNLNKYKAFLSRRQYFVHRFKINYPLLYYKLKCGKNILQN